MSQRRSGILLPVFSLPSRFGIGDLGPSAYAFADFLAGAKQRLWQILPLNPIDSGLGFSPYSASSAFAGNVLFISPDLLAEEGILSPEDFGDLPQFREDACDYEQTAAVRSKLLNRVWEIVRDRPGIAPGFDDFCAGNASWLDGYALFAVIKRFVSIKAWSDWPGELASREETALLRIRAEFAEELVKEKYFQFLFFRQWAKLKRYCRKRGIRVVGDLPIYVSFDSADVWSQKSLFKLDSDLKPAVQAGVPPDYFSATGQRWGNPVYDWDAHRKTGYAWWMERIAFNLNLYDLVRIDHFRGFVACWEVPAAETTAVNGRWVEAPADDFFKTMRRRFSRLPLLAEDLGVITPDVRSVMRRFRFPGMKVLLFAFGSDDPGQPYLPHNYIRNCAAYTGTHDTNTVRGWFEHETSAADRERLFRYIGREVTAGLISQEMIRLVMASRADRVIIPAQDVLGLGAEARINRPSTVSGNWRWRLRLSELTPVVADKLRAMTETTGR
jgi:4-alpha-glucanotransferase